MRLDVLEAFAEATPGGIKLGKLAQLPSNFEGDRPKLDGIGFEFKESKKARRQLLRDPLINMAIHVALEDMRWRGENYRLASCHDAADVIASSGDTIEAARKTKGETAKAFSLIARAVAALAYQPGGVTFLGTHYEAKE